MNKFASTLIIILCALSLFADGAVKPRHNRRPRRPSAGTLERPESLKGRQIGVFNLQKAIGTDVVETAVIQARRRSNLPLKLNDAHSPVRIEIVESDSFGTLAIFPEEFKAKVNVKALAADNAGVDVLAKRLTTELARAALFVLGSGNASYGCLSKSIRTLDELDKLERAAPCAQVFMMLGGGKSLGIGMNRYASYEMACQEGWAPAPTNEFQKAIWDKVHAMPTEPIKIKPETKKVEK